jgi:uncharacterized protein
VKKEAGFWDTSAIVPLCVREANTRLARQHLRSYTPVVWWASSVELHSAICRLNRTNEITQKEYQGALLRFEMLRQGWREVLPDDSVRELAERLLESHQLRAGDSLQLAAALFWCGQRPAKRAFLCADERLSAAAAKVGFAVIRFPGVLP